MSSPSVPPPRTRHTRQLLWPLALLLALCAVALQAAAWTAWPRDAALVATGVTLGLAVCLVPLWRGHRADRRSALRHAEHAEQLQRQHSAAGAEYDQRWREWARQRDEALRITLEAFGVQLRAILDDEDPARTVADAPCDPWLRRLLHTLLDMADEAAEDHQDAYEHALLTLAARMQSGALRVEERARALYDAHDPAVVQLGMDLSHQANHLVHLAGGVKIMGGEWTGQQWQRPIAVADVVQAASGRIPDYTRISLTGDPDVAVVPHAAEYLIHLTAELLANATTYSPPGSAVYVLVEADQHDVVIQIDDQGLGMTEARLNAARRIAAGERLVTLRTLPGPQTGLPVVGNIARRFDIDVHLDPSRYKGVRAMVRVPQDILQPLPTESSGVSRSSERDGPLVPAQHQLPAGAQPPATATPEPGPERTAPAPARVPVPASVPVAERTASGLPKRRADRQPEHGGTPPSADAPSAAEGPDRAAPRSPEEAGQWLGTFLGAGRGSRTETDASRG
ncbi:ATP-binding protein [Streptomyces daliensis]|uniref:histidine kinase n=1 Tax=Streptomyces daliensis TaxID=299421 RepID=A0A8T4IQ60_9ACTN|nr:ATP-binding protein [Streptomyces daliensis]